MGVESTPRQPPDYRGRFAPSPTGPLHFGSLVAAVGSYLDARGNTGSWEVRIEDIDHDRELPGAADAILCTLEACGFQWDGPVLRQTTRLPAYANALDHLERTGMSFPCCCSRKDVAKGNPGDECNIYPGTCRNGLPPGRRARSIRLRAGTARISFRDGVHGGVHQDIAREVGDFVVRRGDGFPAYHLAVVVDDGAQAITDVVRGADLLDSTPRQIYLQGLLGIPTPRYLHLPVAVDAAGRKLSKQTKAAPVLDDQLATALFQALDFLGQHPPPHLARAEVTEIWQWAFAHWSRENIPRTLQHPCPPLPDR